MDPNKPNAGFNSSSDGGGSFPRPSSFDMSASSAGLDDLTMQPGNLLSNESYDEDLLATQGQNRGLWRYFTRRNTIIASTVLLSVIAIVIGVNLSQEDTRSQVQSSVSSSFPSQQIPLSGFISTANGVDFGTSNVVVNGALTTNNGLIVSPSAQPAKSVAGQLYFDQNTNQMAYYNGSQYVPLSSQVPAVQSIAGISGALTLGGGLSVVGNQLTVTFPQTETTSPVFPSHVSSIAGLTGDITVGRGLAMNGSDLQNSGVLSITAGTPNLVVNTDGSGSVTISSVGGGTGTVTSAGGTPGRIGKFTGVQNIEDSLLSEAGSVVTVNGDLSITGTLTLAAPLAVAQGGTGAAALPLNGVVVGQGTSPATTVVAGGAGLCLISTAGAPAFQACPSGAGVSSLDGLTGALTIANTTTAGSTITINDATTAAKGIASFNSTNLSVTSGTVNTVQNINMAATPTFSGVSTNAITPTSALTVGATGQSFTMQGTAASTITAANGGNTTTVSFQPATSNATYRFAATSAGTYDICTTAGNCVGVGGSVTTPGGTTGTLAKFTGAQTLADSSISDSGALVTITGNASVTGNLVLGTALGVGNGGTGATTFTNNGVIIGNGSGAMTAVAAGGAGQCLVSTAGAPSFQACPGSGGVTSVNGLTGVIAIANASGAGSTITINDATTGSKGLASFNATNFTVTGGAVNTVQDIASTSAPTFGQLSLTSSQASNPMLLINNTNTGATGSLLDLQVNGSSKFSVQPNGNTAVSGTVNGQTVSSSASFTGSMAIAGNTTLTGDIAVNGGDITSSGALNITPGGTLTIGSGTQTMALQGGAGTSLVVASGANTTTVNFQAPTANVTYRIPTATAGTYDICTTAGNCVGSGGGVSTAGGSTNRLAKFSGSQVIGDSSITDNGTTVTTTANMVVQGGSITAGVANSQTGSLVLAYGSGNFSGTVTPGALTGNRSYTLPDASGTFCLNGSSSCGFIAGTGTAFVQGGNTLGADADFGTNDLTAVNVRTNGTTRLTIGSTGNATFTGDVAVNGGDITSSSALNIKSTTGALTLGDSGQTLGLQGGAATSLTVTSGANTTTVNFQAPTAAVTYRFAAASAGAYDICTTVGNCTGTGGGVTTPGGTANKLAKFTAGQVVGDSTITDNGTTVTTTANFVIQGGTGTFGVAGTQNGTVILANTSGFSGSLGTATLTGNQTYTLPDASGTFCLTSGNCLGPVGNGANISLSNLSSVAINTSLLPGAATIDLGASGNAFRNLYLAGSSASPASNYFQITGAATGVRTITLPDASGTVCLTGSASCGFATGSGAAFVNGGNNFGAGTANLGTNNAEDLALRTGGTTRVTIASDGSQVSLASNTDLLMQGASAYISNTQGFSNGESFGYGAITSYRSVAVGGDADGSGNDAVAVGYNTTSSNTGVTIGSEAVSSNTGGVAVGYQTNAAYNAISVGTQSSAFNSSVAIGAGAGAGQAGSIALGTGAATTASNQMVVGADGFEIDHIYVGSGVTDATPTGFTLQATGGSGTNIAGASMTISGGASTGNANGGSIDLQIAAPGTSGSSANVPVTVLSLSGSNGSAVFKNAANSASAFDVQTQGGASVLKVNTSATSVAVGGSFSATGNINTSGGTLQTNGSTRIDNAGNLINIGNITANVSMTVSAGSTLALQGSGTTTLSEGSGGTMTTVGFTGTATGGVRYDFDRAATPGTYTICTSVGNCSGAAATLQSVYNNSSSPEIVLDSTRGGLTLRDNATPLGGNLFEVQNNGGGTTYFGVTASGVNVNGAASVTGNINSSAGALQTAGTTRVDSSGNLTNIGNITGTGAVTIASTGGGNNVIVDGAGIFSVIDSATFNSTVLFNSDVDYSLDSTQNVAIDGTYTGTTAINMVDGTFTNNTTSGAQNIMQLQNQAGTGTTEAIAVFNNADTDTVVNDGLLVTSAAGGMTDGIDVSDSDITNALNFGSNTLLGTTGDIDTTYFDVTGSTGSFTSAGTATIQGGTVTVGTGSQTGSLVLYDGSSNTGTIQTAALSTNQTYTLPATGGTICIQSSTSCSFAPTTGGTGYIQNQSASQQATSSFWVSNTGRIDGGLTTNNVTSSSGALILQAATNVISLGGSDSLTANGGFSIFTGTNSSLSVAANGTGTLNLGDNAVSSRVINIGATGSQANTSTINIGTSTAAAQTVNVGGTSGTSTLQGGSIVLKTNNTTRATLDTSNNLYLGLGATAATPTAFTVQATSSSSTASAGAQLAVQGGNGASSTTGSAGGDLLLSGGNAGGTGNNNGGNIVLHAGNYTGTGTTGAVVIQNASDGIAFQLKNAAATQTLMQVDTSDMVVNLGSTGTGNSTTVNIATSTGQDQYVNIGSATSISETLIQSGTGNLTLQSTSSVIVKSLTNGAGAFKVTNSSGTSILAVDTQTNIVSTDGLQVNGTFAGAGLTDCDAQNSKLLWDATTKAFSCGTDRASVTVYKTSNETVNNSATLQDDNDFLFSVGANETWAFQIYTTVTSNTTADFKDAFSVPTGSTCNITSDDLWESIQNNSATCTATFSHTHTDTVDHPYFIFGTVKTGGTSGTVQFRWAQDTATAVNTVVHGGTYMVAFKMTGADIAEAYYTKDNTITPGTVIAVDGSIQAGVKKTGHAYDNTAMGIVSTEPGMVLGDPKAAGNNGNNKMVLLALSGRVPVRVSMENGPIKPGDYLTTSSTPGVAMKATQPGQMIGKALESFNGSSADAQGLVMTFANLTWANPNSSVTANNDLQGLTNVSGDLNVSGALTTENLTVTGIATIKTINVGTMKAGSIDVTGTAKIGGDIAFQGAGQKRNAVTKQFVASKPIMVGDVVIIDAEHDGQVTTTTTKNDAKVVGIAMTAAQQAGDTIDVAIGGTVQVNTATGASLQGGDLLSSSVQAGTADKADPPQPGAVLGKALGKPDGDSGLTWVLVTLD